VEQWAGKAEGPLPHGLRAQTNPGSSSSIQRVDRDKCLLPAKVKGQAKLKFKQVEVLASFLIGQEKQYLQLLREERVSAHRGWERALKAIGSQRLGDRVWDLGVPCSGVRCLSLGKPLKSSPGLSIGEAGGVTF
jgi:hypothetical protein